MMRVIKRYPNRKLYDTEEKQYVALEKVADLIRGGEKVYVVDNVTGEDLTSLTLTQIILEQEKRQSGSLPQGVLTGLIQAGGDTLSVLRRSLASPLDLIHQVDEEIERRVQGLVNRGELAEEEGRKLLEKLLARGRPKGTASGPSEEDIERALSRRGVPSRDDMQQLVGQLELLTQKLEELSAERHSQVREEKQ